MQHHWRGVAFERGLLRREFDAAVCARLRAMHLVKHVELRHQFKALREAVGENGLPSSAVEAYVTVLYHLTRHREHPSVCGDGGSRGGGALADRKKLVGSGVLVYLASLITTKPQSRQVGAMVKAIMLEIATCEDGAYVVDVLACTMVQRVVLEAEHLLAQQADSTTYSQLASSIELVAVLAEVVSKSKQTLESSAPPPRATMVFTDGAGHPDTSERAYRLKVLKASAKTHLLTPFVVQVLFTVLKRDSSTDAGLCVKALHTLRLFARSFGFPEVLEALTRNGGRYLDSVTQLFDHSVPAAAFAAIELFHELTDRPDARKGLTTAGAPQLLLSWCTSSIESSKTPNLHVLGLIGVALLARQTHHATSSTKLLASLPTLPARLDELYSCLLELVLDERSAEKVAAYLLSVNALPSLLQFLLQVKPSCMDSAFQNARQRNVSCVVLGRLVKVPRVAQLCFSEDTVNHLALSLQCNRLDEIEGLVPKMSAHERYIHVLGSREACKALSRLSRCPSTGVDASLRPSLTSASVPELPQALICDVLFRLHALEDLIATIKSPSDGAEFVDLELERTLAAVELGGYLRPLPFGEAARVRFLKVSSSSSQLQRAYASEKLLALVELVAPAILQVLREPSACVELVSACCTALSRLSCTNAACSKLLAQGCLQVALVHLPEILSVVPSNGHSPTRQSYVLDSSVDDRRLLDVPAAFFTLVGKLCAVAEGRTAVMRAQVLPRLLKRLQLRNANAKSADEDCKGEIAVVVQQLAMTNAVEGNTSELFLHFHVLDLMTQLAQEQDIASILRGKAKPHKWRLLDHALGAIAALSQDVLVCVPKVVELGVLKLVLPFVVREQQKSEALCRAESLQYHAVSIVRSVAAYPFGRYHAVLQAVDEDKHCLKTSDASDAVTTTTTSAAPSGSPPTRLLDKVKKVAYNFVLELETRPTSSLDRKTVGELARETLTFIHDCTERVGSAAATSVPLSSDSASRRASTRLPVGPVRRRQEERDSFPAIPSSPLSPQQRRESSALGDSDRSPAQCSSPRLQLAPVRSTPLLPSQSSPSRMVLSPSKSTSSSQVLRSGSASTLGGVDLLTTRPTANKPQPSPERAASRLVDIASSNQAQQPQAVYTFARPKATKMKNDSSLAGCLMLDPLFQSSPCVSTQERDSLEAKRRRKHRTEARKRRSASDADDNSSTARPAAVESMKQPAETSYEYVHEIDRFGHCVNVRARRATPGDTYAPSQGHISMNNTR